MKSHVLIRFDGFELDLAARSLKRDGQLVALSPKTFDLLAYLVAHPNEVLSKDRLLTAVWPNSFVEESNLSQHVFLLRKALVVAGGGERMVVTVPGKGYQFAGVLEPSPALGPPGAAGTGAAADERGAGNLLIHAVRSVTSVIVEEETEDAAPAPTPGRRWRARRWLWVGVAAAVLVSGAWLGWRWLHPVPLEHIDAVLSELENKTGDADFDRTLNQALQIDLEQSPFMNLLSRSAIQETLAEMQRRNEALTPALAREVCERNNAGVSLGGTLSRLGNRYLLTLYADSCVSGKRIAGDKEEASSKEAVLQAVDTAAGRLRRQLGESAASEERYQMPIAEATTPSFEALLAYTRAGESFRRGDMKASQLLLERAIALDPNFASAYRILASSYYNLNDFSHAAMYYKKAFDLRERTTERERLGIEAMYYGYALNDFEESIRRTRQFLDIYPNVANSWVSLCNLYDLLGEYGQAIGAAEHAIRLDPHSGVAAVELMRAEMRLGRFAEAKATAVRAMADGKEHWDIHSMLFRIAFAEGDAAARHREGEWGLTHQHAALALEDLGLAAASEGRLREAEADLERAASEAMRDGEGDLQGEALRTLAEVETDFGRRDMALSALKRMSGEHGGPGSAGMTAALRAENGDLAAARQFVADASAAGNRNTLEAFVYVPAVRSLLALTARKPEEAVALLEPARPYQLRDYRVPYLRGEAEADWGRLDAAEADCRLILSNRGVDPISPLHSLAHLRLARVLARDGRIEEAREQYGALFQAWKDADADLPLLAAAKQEYGRIASSGDQAKIR